MICCCCCYSFILFRLFNDKKYVENKSFCFCFFFFHIITGCTQQLCLMGLARNCSIMFCFVLFFILNFNNKLKQLLFKCFLKQRDLATLFCNCGEIAQDKIMHPNNGIAGVKVAFTQLKELRRYTFGLIIASCADETPQT